MTDYVREFDSLEEAWAEMARATERANRDLSASQRAVTWGSPWVRFWAPPGQAGVVVIFGKVWTLDEIAAGERGAGAEDEGEVAHTIANLQVQHERGYMFGRAWSVIEPDGELGDTHRANLWPIKDDLLEQARSRHWDIKALNLAGRTALAEAFDNYRRHVLAVARRSQG